MKIKTNRGFLFVIDSKKLTNKIKKNYHDDVQFMGNLKGHPKLKKLSLILPRPS